MKTLIIPVLRKREEPYEVAITNAPSNLAELGRMAWIEADSLLECGMRPFVGMAKDRLQPGESVDFAELVAERTRLAEAKKARELKQFYPWMNETIQTALQLL